MNSIDKPRITIDDTKRIIETCVKTVFGGQLFGPGRALYNLTKGGLHPYNSNGRMMIELLNHNNRLMRMSDLPRADEIDSVLMTAGFPSISANWPEPDVRLFWLTRTWATKTEGDTLPGLTSLGAGYRSSLMEIEVDQLNEIIELALKTEATWFDFGQTDRNSVLLYEIMVRANPSPKPEPVQPEVV